MSECNVDIDRACNFLKVSEEDIKDMFDRKSLESELLLHWSKLLEYDFFRIYSCLLYTSASKVSARRFFPNFLNLDATFNQHEDWKADNPRRFEYEVATMGCRTRVFENRFGKKTSIGRGNLSFSTINLVRIALECRNIENEKERIDCFYSKLNQILDLTALQLHRRFEFQKTAAPKQFPLLMSVLWEGCEQVKDENTIEKVINQGTLGIGFIGLAEALVALVGKHHGEDEQAQKLGLEIRCV